MEYKASFFKDRQKFSAAHFTMFDDGDLERLHGHNYVVSVTVTGVKLERGLLFPFHTLKADIRQICDAWDEYVLMPTESDWVTHQAREEQHEFHVKTPKYDKFYSFPKEDVVLLPCDNVSSENLAAIFCNELKKLIQAGSYQLTELEVSLAESSGQNVTVRQSLTD